MMNLLEYYIGKILVVFKPRAIKRSQISKKSKVQGGSSFLDSELGEFSLVGYNCSIENTQLGRYVSVADDVKIGLRHHPLNWIGTSPVFYDNNDFVGDKISFHQRAEHKRTIIGNDVWIGHSAIIIQGVRVGDGSVIAAGSVVAKDVEPFAIVAGVPARTLKWRFERKVISEIMEIQWWNLPHDKLKRFAAYTTNAPEFIRRIKNDG